MSLPFLATKDDVAKLKAALKGAMSRAAILLSSVVAVGAAAVAIVSCPSS